MADWTGRGGGRHPGQPRISDESPWEGKGKGKGKGAGQAIYSGTRSFSLSGSTPKSENSRGKKTNSDTLDPEGNYVFALEIDGTQVAHFTEVSGLKTSTEVYELQEGGMNHRVHKLPGQSRWENLTLRYGVTADATLIYWRNEVLADTTGEDVRKNGAIVVMDNQMQPVRRYTFYSAWPVSWEGPSLSSGGSELAIEMIELAHAGIEIS